MHDNQTQISQHAIANVTYSISDRNKNLTYLLGQIDQERLDGNEGVPNSVVQAVPCRTRY